MDTLPDESPDLTVDEVEWLPSGGATGLLRIRGSFAGQTSGARPGLPVLIVAGPDGAAVRHRSLPEPRPVAADAWRGAYVLRADVLAATQEVSVESERGGRLRVELPATARAGGPRPVSLVPEEPGGEVIDRAVMAERRARRAEDAERAQAAIAAEALKAVEVLELRGTELERRVAELEEADASVAAGLEDQLLEARADAMRLGEELAAARTAAAQEVEVAQARARAQAREEAAAASEPELRRLREALEAAEDRAQSGRVALAGAVEREKRLRRTAAGLQARLRSSELARTSDGVRLAVLHEGRSALRDDLRAAREALADRDEELEQLRSQLDVSATTVEDAYATLEASRAERAAARTRAAGLQDELRAAQDRLGSVGEALSEARAAAGRQADALRAEQEAREAALSRAHESRTAAAEASAQLRVERVARATLAADLDEARRALRAAEAEGRTASERARSAEAARDAVAADLKVARTRLAAVEEAARVSAEPASQPAVVRELPGIAGGLAGRASVLGQTREANSPDPDRSNRLRSDLDAAAAALRARTPAEPERAPEPGTTPARPVQAPTPAEPPHRPARPLREVLVDVAAEDPSTAARLIVGLLPAYGAVIGGRVDFDLTVSGHGTTAVTVRGARTRVRRLLAPRSRLFVDFRVDASASALARVLAGAPSPPGHRGDLVRLKGRRKHRAREHLQGLAATELSLAAVARSGARFDPADVFAALPYAIDPGWTRGSFFTIAFEVTGEGAGAWLLTVADGARISVRTVVSGDATASVRMTREAFDARLRGEPAPGAELRGDREAFGRLETWLGRARAAGAGSTAHRG